MSDQQPSQSGSSSGDSGDQSLESLASALSHRPMNPSAPPPTQSPAASPFDSISHSPRSMAWRRTIVPILLTSGTLSIVLAGLWFATDIDSPFRSTGRIVPLAMIPFGIMLICMGILNAMVIHRATHPSSPGR